MLEKQQIVISYFRQGKSQREIAKAMKINRQTVKRYIDQYEHERSKSIDHGGGVVCPPKYDSSKRSNVRLTDQIVDQIDHYLEQNEQRRNQGLAKQCMAGVDIYEALVNQGYQIGYTTVCRYIRQHKQSKQECFVRQTYAPGSTAEFDWGMVKLNIGGKWKNLMLAAFTLSYSNHRWGFLFQRQDMPSFLDAHVRYFQFIKGIPGQVVYDNMRVAVAKCTMRQADKKPTEDLLKISSYYQFDYRFCNVARGNEKGHVEKSVEYVRRKAFAQNVNFDSLDLANQHLGQVLDALNQKQAKGQSCSINSQLKQEQPHFGNQPLADYDTALLTHYRIDKYHTISIDTNHYSVPESIQTPTIGVKVYPGHIHLLDGQHQRIGIHQRRHSKHQWYINIDHYWNCLAHKPGALVHSEAMRQADLNVKSLFDQFYKHIPKVFIDLMLYGKQQHLSIQALHQATVECKKRCMNSEITSDRIIMLLQNKPSQTPQKPPNVATHTMSTTIWNHCTEQLQSIQDHFINSSSHS